MKEVDITVIGGGINGVSVAAEAASRGLSTLLIHDADLAASGSSTPVTLAGTHLEHLSALDIFQLNSMLDELQRLTRVAPHLVDFLTVTSASGSPIKDSGHGIVDKYLKGVRDKCFAQLNETEPHEAHSYGARIRPARLILCKALQARQHGARILTYHKLSKTRREQHRWILDVENLAPGRGECQRIASNIIINCGGWLANDLLENVLQTPTRCKAAAEHRTQFFFRNPGLPLEYCGPTDAVLKLENNQKKAFYVYSVADGLLAFGPRKCDQQGYAECIDLLQSFIDCWNANIATDTPALTLTREHFIYQRKALMALIADPCSHADTPLAAPLLDLNNPGKAAILLNIFGVDAVLHRKVAHQALEVLRPFCHKKAVKQFATEILPGGDLHALNAKRFSAQLIHEYSQMPPAMLTRMAHSYGSLSYALLSTAKTPADLGVHFGDTLYEREVRYLVENEWATCAEDILWRRSLLGVVLQKNQQSDLQNWIQTNLNTP